MPLIAAIDGFVPERQRADDREICLLKEASVSLISLKTEKQSGCLP